MTNMVVLAGVPVDADDPCALWQALYAAKLKRIAGESFEEVEIQSPATRRRIRVAATSMADLDRELEELARACAAKRGERRRRYAKQMRFSS